MDLVVVNAAGLALIAWIVWYFFLSRRPERGEAAAGPSAQEILVTVKGGYLPEVIAARPGAPLRIHFRREETSACSEEVVFPDFGITRRLPAFETTVIEIPPSAAGAYGFRCGMDMMHGTLILGGSGASPAPVPPLTDARETDPICGMSVDPARAAATSVRDGRTIYFCSTGCKARFDGDAAPVEPRITLGVRPKR